MSSPQEGGGGVCVDSSYHVLRTKVGIRGVLFEALAYIVRVNQLPPVVASSKACPKMMGVGNI
jgi:hypothetical protein